MGPIQMTESDGTFSAEMGSETPLKMGPISL